MKEVSGSSLGDLGDFIERARPGMVQIPGKVKIEEETVDIRTFIESDDYLNQPPRTEFVYQELERILGESPNIEKIFSFDRLIKEYVGLWGKGSGKSTTGFLVELYLIYILLSVKSPLGYFQIPDTDYLSFVNVSVAGKQAKEEYFIRMKNCLQHASYFRRYYDIYDSKSIINKAEVEKRGTIDMKSDTIDFPKGLKAVSVHSHNESWEGKNIIFWCMDEASGFVTESGQYNADKIYNTLTTSVREFPYLGLIFSFPRLDKEHDWTYKKYEESKDIEGVEGTQKSTWEVKPQKFYSGKNIPFTFTTSDNEVITVEIPVEYQKQATTDPENFLAKFMAICAAGGGKFFEGMNLQIIPSQRMPIFDLDTFIIKSVDGKKYINKDILKKNYPMKGDKIVLTLDQSSTNCQAVMMLGHKEKILDAEGKVQIFIVVDLIIVYSPDPEKGWIVDHDNFTALAQEIVDKVGGVDLVRMDHWNALNLKQKLEKNNIKVSIRGPQKTSYEKTRSVCLYGRVDFPYQIEEIEKLTNELKALDKPTGNRKPRVLYGLQDLADCFAQLVEELWDETALDVSEIPVGNIIASSLSPDDIVAGKEKDRVDRMFRAQERVDQMLLKRIKTKITDRKIGVGSAISYGRGGSPRTSDEVKKRMKEIADK